MYLYASISDSSNEGEESEPESDHSFKMPSRKKNYDEKIKNTNQIFERLIM